jgi:pantoate--beta-alanine ligase
VLKLFAAVQPSTAVFGKKDYQQLLVIRNMVRQFALPVDIIAAETVRSAAGLALSSRNGYLDDVQRAEAAQLQYTLREAAAGVRSGRADFASLERQAMEYLTQRGWRPDYVAIRRQDDLQEAAPGEAVVVLGAAKLGSTRLIDNVEV